MSTEKAEMVKQDALPSEIAEVSGDVFLSLRLMGASAENQGTQGVFAIIGGIERVDLGNKISALVCAYRMRALDYSNSKDIRVSTDSKSPLYREIHGKTGIKNSDCMSGAEYLLFIPNFGFIPYWCASKGAQRINPSLYGAMLSTVTLSTELIKKAYTFWVPKIAKCEEVFDLPSETEIKEAVEAFMTADAQAEADHAEKVAARTR